MTASDALLAAIIDAPTDEKRWFAVNVLADWLEDVAGEHDKSEAWRWLAANEHWPYSSGSLSLWSDATYYEVVGEPLEPDELSPSVHRAFMRRLGALGQHSIHDSPSDALLAAVAAFLSAKASGWQPEWPETKPSEPVHPEITR